MMKHLPFSALVRDVSGGNAKVAQSEFLSNGDLPIVDQGKSFIAGYTDSSASVFKSSELPVIVFGDHTKAIKFIDFPFAMGADGIKVLKANKDCDSKYLYHYLRQVILPDAGYSRHYKFLKELFVPLPSLPEQRRIAGILDKADAVRSKRRDAIAKLDQLLKSVFLQMFGDPATNPKGWPIGKITDLLESFTYGSSEKAASSGDVPILRMNNITSSGEMNLTDLKYLPADRVSDKHLVEVGDVLFNRTNSKELVGKTAVYDGPSTMAYAGYLVRARPKDAASAHYISRFLNSSYGKATLRGMCKSIVGMANINAKEFSAIEIAIPPIAVQRDFASRVKAIRDYRRKLEAHQGVLDKLFGSLQQRAFAGDL